MYWQRLNVLTANCMCFTFFDALREKITRNSIISMHYVTCMKPLIHFIKTHSRYEYKAKYKSIFKCNLSLHILFIFIDTLSKNALEMEMTSGMYH